MYKKRRVRLWHGGDSQRGYVISGTSWRDTPYTLSKFHGKRGPILGPVSSSVCVDLGNFKNNESLRALKKEIKKRQEGKKDG